MTERPTAAPPHWPYHEHRTIAEVDRQQREKAIADAAWLREAHEDEIERTAQTKRDQRFVARLKREAAS
jgi:hypothetical protein